MLGASNIIAFIPITDSNRARHFYEGVLGLRFVQDDDFALVLEANGVMVRAAKMKEFVPAQFTILGWQVSDIETTVRELGKKGVQFEVFGFAKQNELGVWTSPSGAKVAWFKDPDGNVLSVTEYP